MKLNIDDYMLSICVEDMTRAQFDKMMNAVKALIDLEEKEESEVPF